MKAYYLAEADRVSEKVLEYKNCFKFAAVADSHIDNSISDTFSNIKAVDKKVDFKCLVHLGDFLNGNLPRHYTKAVLKDQMDGFQGSINGKDFYPVQGNHDGFKILTATGGASSNIALDEDWHEATAFVDLYKNVSRPGNKPYFFVDYPEDMVRMIVLCNFFYEGGSYKKKFGIDTEQLKWIKDVAVDIGEGWTVMIFSHDLPIKSLNEDVCEENSKINGIIAMDIIKEACNKNKFDFAGWFIGHTHGDYIGKAGGINFILVASETAYIPQLWDMPEGGYYPDRELNTVSEDLWDCVVLDKQNRKIKIFRFGAGKDREIDY